ncbi:unnamed protein product [Diplocarpon coronariae]
MHRSVSDRAAWRLWKGFEMFEMLEMLEMLPWFSAMWPCVESQLDSPSPTRAIQPSNRASRPSSLPPPPSGKRGHRAHLASGHLFTYAAHRQQQRNYTQPRTPYHAEYIPRLSTDKKSPPSHPHPSAPAPADPATHSVHQPKQPLLDLVAGRSVSTPTRQSNDPAPDERLATPRRHARSECSPALRIDLRPGQSSRLEFLMGLGHLALRAARGALANANCINQCDHSRGVGKITWPAAQLHPDVKPAVKNPPSAASAWPSLPGRPILSY